MPAEWRSSSVASTKRSGWLRRAWRANACWISWIGASCSTPSSWAASAGDMRSAHPLRAHLQRVDPLRDGRLAAACEGAQAVAHGDHLGLAEGVLELAEPPVDLVQLDRVLVRSHLQGRHRDVGEDAPDLALLLLEHAGGAVP